MVLLKIIESLTNLLIFSSISSGGGFYVLGIFKEKGLNQHNYKFLTDKEDIWVTHKLH